MPDATRSPAARGDAAEPAAVAELPDPPAPADVHARVVDWFAEHARDLPWRRPECTPWGVLVSEVMLQQTPVARVLPRWEEWLRRWPTPADAAAAPAAEILTVWDRLGYPRRALRLQAAAEAIVDRHGGEVPDTREELRALPGIGEYTAAAVACFAFSRPEVVVDTNIRRVHARVFSGAALPGQTYTAAQRRLAVELMPATEPDGGRTACAWNAATMELGALICTARSPQCAICPVAELCSWRAAGFPPPTEEQKTRGQAWAGTDRQVRGALMAVLRRGEPVEPEALLDGLDLPEASADQRRRCLDSLLADGLAQRTAAGVTLPQ
ncbi:A/G-specific adenine glycosylase [Nesterenkonia halobia]|uniref:Adenine DNA glycosylase n=1 Tax=Nesterenkonia halobia TaxID=37922 RepID=A0ABP6RCC7_9MICC